MRGDPERMEATQEAPSFTKAEENNVAAFVGGDEPAPSTTGRRLKCAQGDRRINELGVEVPQLPGGRLGAEDQAGGAGLGGPQAPAGHGDASGHGGRIVISRKKNSGHYDPSRSVRDESFQVLMVSLLSFLSLV